MFVSPGSPKHPFLGVHELKWLSLSQDISLVWSEEALEWPGNIRFPKCGRVLCICMCALAPAFLSWIPCSKAEARLGRADQCQTPIILKVTNYNWKCVEIGYWQFIASLMKEDCDSSDDKLPANLELMWDLLHVDACKSMGSNEIHPRVLRAGQHQGQASLNCLSVGICRGASWLPDKEWPR